jgi:hypothetical protein
MVDVANNLLEVPLGSRDLLTDAPKIDDIMMEAVVGSKGRY